MLSALLWLACNADEDSGRPAPSTCAEEERAGLLEVGDVFGDAVRPELIAMDPEPAVVGDNTWTFGLPEQGCEGTASPFMPDHGHGSSVDAVRFEGDTLTLEGLFLSMGGVWEVRLDLDCPSASEELVVALCVEP